MRRNSATSHSHRSCASSWLKSKASLTNLGPPLRAAELNANASGEEVEGDRKDGGTESHDSKIPLTPATKQGPIFPHASNKENQIPLTSSPVRVVCDSSETVETVRQFLPSDPKAQATPSSTYPCYLGPSSSVPKLESRFTSRQAGHTPSSTFPESRPLHSLPIENEQLPQSMYASSQPTSHAPVNLQKASDIPTGDENGTGTTQDNCFHPVPHQSGLTSKHQPYTHDQAHKLSTSKPPLPFDCSTTKRSQTNHRCIPNPDGLLTFSPEHKDGDIVVMRSQYEERKFKRVALLGCGGSSKVR